MSDEQTRVVELDAHLAAALDEEADPDELVNQLLYEWIDATEGGVGDE